VFSVKQICTLYYNYDYIIAIDFLTVKIHRLDALCTFPRVRVYAKSHNRSILYAFYVSAWYLREIRHFTLYIYTYAYQSGMAGYYHKYDVRTGLGRRVNKNPIVNPFYRFVYTIVYKSRTKSAAGESEIGRIPLSFYNIYYYYYNVHVCFIFEHHCVAIQSCLRCIVWPSR